MLSGESLIQLGFGQNHSNFFAFLLPDITIREPFIMGSQVGSMDSRGRWEGIIDIY